MMKQTKRISALMCAMLLIICTSFSAFALTDYKLIDDAKLFSSSQTKEINQALADASSTTGWSVIVYTNTKGVSSTKITNALKQVRGWTSEASEVAAFSHIQGGTNGQ